MRKEVSLEDLQKPFRTGHCAVHCVSLRGISHETNGLPMQDSYAATELENGWIVLAVADGVGSEPRSETGARIAAQTVVNHLKAFRGYKIDEESIRIMLLTAYDAACAEIFEQAMKDHASMREYSTTLHTVIFSDGMLYIMHAGDGGVAILTEEGQFRKITSPMKGPDGESVIPLQAGPDSWRFSVCAERAQSVVVATDGIWDKLCPSVLENYGFKSGMETSIASFFMSPWARNWREEPLEQIAEKETAVFRGEQQEAVPEFYSTLVRAIGQGNGGEEAQEIVKTRIAPGNMPVRMLRGIKDDITMMTLVRFDPEPQKIPLKEYPVPDWNAVNQWVQNMLNPAGSLSVKKQAEEQQQEEKPTYEMQRKKTNTEKQKEDRMTEEALQEEKNASEGSIPAKKQTEELN